MCVLLLLLLVWFVDGKRTKAKKKKKKKKTEMKVKNMQALGFEPRPPERLQPECSALDRLGHACLHFWKRQLSIVPQPRIDDHDAPWSRSGLVWSAVCSLKRTL